MKKWLIYQLFYYNYNYKINNLFFFTIKYFLKILLNNFLVNILFTIIVISYQMDYIQYPIHVFNHFSINHHISHHLRLCICLYLIGCHFSIILHTCHYCWNNMYQNHHDNCSRNFLNIFSHLRNSQYQIHFLNHFHKNLHDDYQKYLLMILYHILYLLPIGLNIFH
jgi:hypothetical protein